MKALSLPALGIVVLAAGFSARLGSPKALARVHGVTLLHKTLRTVLPFATSKVFVVVPRRGGHYEIGADRRSVAFIPNPRRAGGLSSSVRVGLRAARHCAGVLLLPVDLVDLDRRDIERLIQRWRGARRKIAARRLRAAAGTPLILPRWMSARAGALAGDQGLREVVRRLAPDQLCVVRLPSAESDVDTRADLDRARRRWRRAPTRA